MNIGWDQSPRWALVPGGCRYFHVSMFDTRLTAERRRRYNACVHGEEDIIDDLVMMALLEDEKPPSDKAICIVLVAIVIVFVVCLAL